MPKVMVHTGKNQIACDPPLTAASLSEWCNEERKISPSKALTRILEQLMKEQPWGSPVRTSNVFKQHQENCVLWGAGSAHGSSKTLCTMGAGKSFPHPEEISSLLQTTLHREKLEKKRRKSFPLGRHSLFGNSSLRTRNGFSPCYVAAANNQDLCLVL